MTPTEMQKKVLDMMTTLALTVLAAPLLVIPALRRLPKIVAIAQRLAAGAATCPYCGAENPLNLMTRCPACGAVEPGSRLRCSFCRAVFDTITCGGCGATVRVL